MAIKVLTEKARAKALLRAEWRQKEWKRARKTAGFAAKDRQAADLASKTTTKFTQVGMWSEVQARLQDLGLNKPIEGGLTITGHNYWVIVEYGASPASVNAGPQDSDPVLLTLPDTVPESKGWQDRYPIVPRNKKMLRFFWKGRWRRTFVIHHPGSLGRGFLRKYIGNVIKSLSEGFESIFDNTSGASDEEHDTIPGRAELVEIVNWHLLMLLDAVKAATPVANAVDGDGNLVLDKRRTGDDTGHLAEAWGVDLAASDSQNLKKRTRDEKNMSIGEF